MFFIGDENATNLVVNSTFVSQGNSNGSGQISVSSDYDAIESIDRISPLIPNSMIRNSINIGEKTIQNLEKILLVDQYPIFQCHRKATKNRIVPMNSDDDIDDTTCVEYSTSMLMTMSGKSSSFDIDASLEMRNDDYDHLWKHHHSIVDPLVEQQMQQMTLIPHHDIITKSSSMHTIGSFFNNNDHTTMSTPTHPRLGIVDSARSLIMTNILNPSSSISNHDENSNTFIQSTPIGILPFILRRNPPCSQQIDAHYLPTTMDSIEPDQPYVQHPTHVPTPTSGCIHNRQRISLEDQKSIIKIVEMQQRKEKRKINQDDATPQQQPKLKPSFQAVNGILITATRSTNRGSLDCRLDSSNKLTSSTRSINRGSLDSSNKLTSSTRSANRGSLDDSNKFTNSTRSTNRGSLDSSNKFTSSTRSTNRGSLDSSNKVMDNSLVTTTSQQVQPTSHATNQSTVLPSSWLDSCLLYCVGICFTHHHLKDSKDSTNPHPPTSTTSTTEGASRSHHHITESRRKSLEFAQYGRFLSSSQKYDLEYHQHR